MAVPHYHLIATKKQKTKQGIMNSSNNIIYVLKCYLNLFKIVPSDFGRLYGLAIAITH